MRFHLRSTRTVAAVAASLLLVLAACSDDDDGASDTSSSDDSTAEASNEEAADATAADETFCSAITATEAALVAEDPDAATAALDEVEANVPDAVTEEAAVLVEYGRASVEDPEGAEEPEGFAAAYTAIQDFQVDTCAYHEVELSAIEYAYQDLPATLPEGNTVFRLTNDGSEFHELLLLRINDDVTESAEELLALPQEEAETKVTAAGIAFAPVGASSGASADLEAGQYIAVCFLPVGSTPEAFEAGGPPDAPPHFTEGMFQELQVG